MDDGGQSTQIVVLVWLFWAAVGLAVLWLIAWAWMALLVSPLVLWEWLRHQRRYGVKLADVWRDSV